MIRQSRKIQFIILLTLVCLVGTMTIAYAILSTTLNITGTTEVIASNWNVHFANIKVNPVGVTPAKTPTITDSKTVDFAVNLKKPGDFYEFYVDIVNDGTIDAMVDDIIKTPSLTAEQAKYIKYEIEYTDGYSINNKQLLSSGETKTVSVLLSYRTDISASDLPKTPTTLNLSILLNYIQADTSSVTIPEETLVRIKNGDINTIGSEICIKEECFHLIKNDGTKVTMFAKYNLYVGGAYNIETKTYTPYGEEATGKQDPLMIGGNKESIIYKGVTEYSNDEQTGTNYNDYNGSLIEKYVNDYNIYMNSLGIKNINTRLISRKELVDLGCILETWTCIQAPKWIYTTSYWTETLSNLENRLWVVENNSAWGGADYYSNSFYGVRPVIEVPITEF